nr:basic phospholipase A2 1-like [Lytechinus pictus]
MDLTMNTFFTFIIVNVCLLFGIGEADLIRRRRPRAVWQFSLMIECATGRPAWHYNNYGCWCGLGGKGIPVDDVDRCCRLHDECYDALVEDNVCSKVGLYLSPYLYQRRHCEWERVEDREISCGEGSACRTGLCECDREAALCLANARFNDQFRHFQKDTCVP